MPHTHLRVGVLELRLAVRNGRLSRDQLLLGLGHLGLECLHDTKALHIGHTPMTRISFPFAAAAEHVMLNASLSRPVLSPSQRTHLRLVFQAVNALACRLRLLQRRCQLPVQLMHALLRLLETLRQLRRGLGGAGPAVQRT